jgi:hypothetical protein
MSRPLPDLIRRQRALQKVVDKYRGKPFDWAASDCVRMARTMLVAAGHRPPPLPRYTTAAGALRALKAAGFDTLGQLFDSLLPRIPAAARLPGDIVLMQSGEAIEAVTIAIGDKLLGWHDEAEGCVVMIPSRIEAVYRV